MPKRRSPDAPIIVKTPRDYSAIAKKTWENRQNVVKELEESNKRLKSDKELLVSERVKLEESNTRLNSDKEELKNTINQLNGDKIFLAGKKEELKENNKELLAEVRLLQRERDSLAADVQNSQEKISELDPILKEVEAIGGLQQISGKKDRLHAIGRFLLSLLSIIMKCTHPITRLRAVCDAVFGLAVCGVTIMKTVLAEVHKNIFMMSTRINLQLGGF